MGQLQKEVEELGRCRIIGRGVLQLEPPVLLNSEGLISDFTSGSVSVIGQSDHLADTESYAGHPIEQGGPMSSVSVLFGFPALNTWQGMFRASRIGVKGVVRPTEAARRPKALSSESCLPGFLSRFATK